MIKMKTKNLSGCKLLINGVMMASFINLVPGVANAASTQDIGNNIANNAAGAAKNVGHSNIFGISVSLTDFGSLGAILLAIPKILMWVVGVISVIFVIVGGIQYIASAGSPDAIKRAKSTIVMALAGLAVAVGSLAIYGLVIKAIAG